MDLRHGAPRRAHQLALALVLGCGPGAPGEDPTGDTTTGAQTTGSATTTQPTTTSSPTPPQTTTGDATSTSSSTTTTGDTVPDPSTGSTTDTWPPRTCIPATHWQEPHLDCLVDWPASTQVEGAGPAAPLGVVTRMYFGVLDYACVPGLWLEPIFIGDSVTPQAVLHYTGAECGPEQWPGSYELTGRLSDDTPFSTTMSIDGFVGDWLGLDPVDPPRILGSFSGDLVGSFEVVHCAALDILVNNCG